MEIVAVIFAALNSVGAIFIGILIKVSDKRADAKSAIKKELRLKFMNFGSIAAAGIPEPDNSAITDFSFEGLDTAAKEMERLHCRSVVDLQKLNRINLILGLTMKLLVSAAIITIVSVLIGVFGINDNQVAKIVLVICIPGFLFLCELAFLVWVVDTGSYLKRVINEYTNSEY